jgi:hypothetical protein
VTRPPLPTVLPGLAEELSALLAEQGHTGLARQVQDLRVFDRCRCGDDNCATFYTAPPPEGAWGPGHTNVVVEKAKGLVVLDVVHDKIVCVEVLDRSDVMEPLLRAVP